jgi:hypothetical protein
MENSAEFDKLTDYAGEYSCPWRTVFISLFDKLAETLRTCELVILLLLLSFGKLA